jgi:hypothetical protein
MKSRVTLLITLLLFSCCIGSDSKEILIFKELIPEKDFSRESVILIIPFDGCSSCLNEATKLIPCVVENSGIVIIPYRHKKRIKFFIKENRLENDGIIIDSLQKTIINKIVNYKPIIFFINHNKIESSELVEYTKIQEIKKKINISKRGDQKW